MTRPRVSIEEARSRLAALRGREYWRSLEELLETEDFREHLHREFRVPIDSGIDRRELLTLMGASIALAGLTGCVRQPTERVFPYVKSPEEIVPGESLQYATAHLHGGYARGILAESYEGRPIKVEGNALHPASLGGTDVFMQGFILNLYDPDRSQAITQRGEIRPWSSFLAAARLALEKERDGKGAGLRFLTGAVTSPTLKSQLSAVLAAFPEAKWVAWEPVGRENVLEGTRLAFGERLEPQPAFDKADVIVSLESDFLGAGPAMPRTVRDFASRRRKADEINRLYVVESTPTLTGARADHRRPMTPDQIEGFARSVAAAVGAGTAAAPADAFASAVAEDLKAHRGSSLVVAGESQPPSVHALAHAINASLGNSGKTVSYTEPAAEGGSTGATLAALVDDMRAGRVSTLVIVGGNPVFDAPADLAFADAMAKVGLRIHLGLYEDETSRLCHWHVNAAHPLECWSDARSLDGTVTILQPLIAPLFAGKTAHELIAAFADQPEASAHDIVKTYWKGKLPGGDFEAAWRKALHDGVVEGSAFPAKSVSLRSAVPPGTRNPEPGTGLTLLLRPDPTIWDGSYANNGWLQELAEAPDQADVGKRGAHQSGHGAEARRDDRGRRRAFAQGPQGRRSGLGPARPGAGLRDGALRKRADARRPCRRRKGFRRLPAANVRRPLVRSRAAAS